MLGEKESYGRIFLSFYNNSTSHGPYYFPMTTRLN